MYIACHGWCGMEEKQHRGRNVRNGAKCVENRRRERINIQGFRRKRKEKGSMTPSPTAHPGGGAHYSAVLPSHTIVHPSRVDRPKSKRSLAKRLESSEPSLTSRQPNNARADPRSECPCNSRSALTDHTCPSVRAVSRVATARTRTPTPASRCRTRS